MKPHIKRVRLRSGAWAWGAFASRASMRPFGMSHVFHNVARIAMRRMRRFA